MGTIIDRLEEIRQELGLNKSDFSTLIGITSAYYSNILKGNGKGNLRLEHLESLLEKKRVNPAWIINGEGKKYITKEMETIVTSTITPHGRPANKKELMDAIMRYCQLRALPGDLSYSMLDKLVEKAFPVEPEITTNPAHTVESLSLAWISMLEFAQQILGQGVEFEYDGKKYGLRPR